MGIELTFSKLERAMTLAGLAPVALLGSGLHGSVSPGLQLPPPSYQTLVPAASPRVAAPEALKASIDALRDNFDGLAGISVRSVDDGWSIDSVDAGRRMPQQSVSKLWVTMTVLDAIDAGRVSLDQPVTITRADLTLFHQPIAAMVKTPAGYTTTVRDLIKRAMTQSDNTANDSLLRTVGGPAAVRSFISRNNLGAIRFGPGERLLQAGTAGLSWRQDYAMGRGFEAARAKLPPDVRQAAYKSYVADPVDGASASAIAAALARLKRGGLLSPQSSAYLIATMEASHTGRYRMRGAVPPGWRFGHKTGTGQNLLSRTAGYNDVGLLTAPDGRSYAVAIMIGDTAKPIKDRQLLMQGVVASIVASHQDEPRTGYIAAGQR